MQRCDKKRQIVSPDTHSPARARNVGEACSGCAHAVVAVASRKGMGTGLPAPMKKNDARLTAVGVFEGPAGSSLSRQDEWIGGAVAVKGGKMVMPLQRFMKIGLQ